MANNHYNICIKYSTRAVICDLITVHEQRS